MKFTTPILLATSCLRTATCAPQGSPVPLPLLVEFFPELNYGGDKYYAASGPFSTCLGVPPNLESIIKSIKLGENVTECVFYEDGTCANLKGKYKVYKKDEPKVTLSPVLSLECTEA